MNSAENKKKKKVVKVGDYNLGKVIGKGTFAVVRLATHLPTGTEVAIKIFDKARLRGDRTQQILQEIEILKAMNHPHIVKLYQLMQSSNFIYLVTEYASGREVFDYIVEHGKMDERQARQVFKQVLSGLFYCRQRHIVHRDLKLENLLFDRNFNVKIADFGFSTVCRPGEKLLKCCGSLHYAAPELFLASEYDGEMVDIWSLGVILYVLTVGKMPFAGCNHIEMMKKIEKGRFDIPTFISKECNDLMRKLLHHNPRKRIPLMKIISHEWMDLGSQDAVIARLLHESLTPPSRSSNILLKPRVIDQMKRMNYTVESIVTSLQGKRFDSIWATYHLLVDKVTRSACRENSPFLLSRTNSCDPINAIKLGNGINTETQKDNAHEGDGDKGDSNRDFLFDEPLVTNKMSVSSFVKDKMASIDLVNSKSLELILKITKKKDAICENKKVIESNNKPIFKNRKQKESNTKRQALHLPHLVSSLNKVNEASTQMQAVVRL